MSIDHPASSPDALPPRVRRSGAIRHVSWVTALAAAGVFAGYQFYLTPQEPQVERSIKDILEDPTFPVRDFESLPNGTVLLDTHDPAFRSFAVRFTAPDWGQHQSVPRSAVVRFTQGRRETGPLVQVGRTLFAIANKGWDGKRYSQHLDTIVRGDAQSMELRSRTRGFRETIVRVTPSMIISLAGKLEQQGGGDMPVLCTVCNGNRSTECYPSLSFDCVQEEAQCLARAETGAR